MAEPWTHRDERGNELTVGTAEDCDGVCWLRVERPEGVTDKWAPSALVDGLDIPEVANAMWRAAGQEPPVMLGRPDLASARDANGWIAFRGVEVRKSDDGGVTFSVGGNTETLTAAQARQCAAVIVALADAPPEPDPAEVDEIAAVIYAGLYPGYAEPPGERARDAARAVLLLLRDREARRA